MCKRFDLLRDEVEYDSGQGLTLGTGLFLMVEGAFSVHSHQHKVGVLDQLLHAGSEPGTSGTINHSVICADAKVDLIRFLNAEAILFGVIIDQFGDAVSLANCNDRGLWAEDSRDEVLATDVSNGRNTECSVVEVCLNETSISCSLRQVFQVTVDLQNTLVLHLFDVGHGETIRAVDCNAEVVVVLQDVPLDVAIVVEVVIDVRIDHGVLTHGNGACFDEEWQHRKVGVHLFHLFAEQDQGCCVHGVGEGERWDRQSLSHCLSHRLLHSCDALDTKVGKQDG